jgi:hypothetical protein
MSRKPGRNARLLVKCLTPCQHTIHSFASRRSGRSVRAPYVLALSRCRTKNVKRLCLPYFQAAVTAVRHVFMAAARKVLCILADVRWRWTLKVL